MPKLTELPEPRPLSAEDLRMLENKKEFDPSIVESVIYFDGWSGYSDYAGAFIFVGIDGSLQVYEYGGGCGVDDDNIFRCQDCSPEEALEIINNLERIRNAEGPEY